MAVTNVIDAIQQYYAAIPSFTGKPDTLWFGTAWPRNASGTLITYPLVRLLHQGTETETTFEGACVETWRFTLEVYAETVQLATTVFDQVRFAGGTPQQRLGFWYPDSVTMPSGYTFESLISAGDFHLDTLDALAAPSGVPTVRLVWPFALVANRTAF